ncbi:hypothetical protein ACWEQL_22135 [Kitasatospora sp. NPDC004240]
MLIDGDDHGPAVPGEELLDHPGFWADHLLGLCRPARDDPRPEPEWFGADGADLDALDELLRGGPHATVFRIPFGAGHQVLLVHGGQARGGRVEFLLDRPDRGRAELLADFEGERYGPGLSWRELTLVAGADDPDADGVHDRDARLLLLLPLLNADGLPARAEELVRAALAAVGAPADTAPAAAGYLLAGARSAPWHDGSWESPLSGGGPDDAGPDHDDAPALSAALRALGATGTPDD